MSSPRERSAELLFGTTLARRTQNNGPNWSSALRFMRFHRLSAQLVFVVLLVVNPRHPIEDEVEKDDEEGSSP